MWPPQSARSEEAGRPVPTTFLLRFKFNKYAFHENLQVPPELKETVEQVKIFLASCIQEPRAGFPLTCVSWFEWNPCSLAAGTDLLFPLHDTAPPPDRGSSSHHGISAAGRTQNSGTYPKDMSCEQEGSRPPSPERMVTTADILPVCKRREVLHSFVQAHDKFVLLCGLMLL